MNQQKTKQNNQKVCIQHGRQQSMIRVFRGLKTKTHALLSQRTLIAVVRCVVPSSAAVSAFSRIRSTCQLSLTRQLTLITALVATFLLPTSYFLLRPAQQVSAQTPNTTVNFQARILTSSGALVPDGNYHIEFKIYDTIATGATAQGTCSGNCLWMETRTTGNLVRVVNGYVSANLGSVTAFGSTIPWSQDLYITMRVGGAGGAASWDTEMTNSGNRLKLSSTPLALVSNNVRTANRTSAASDNIVIQTGTTTTSGNSGNITIDTGTAAGTTGTITLGATSASALTLGRASFTTTNAGALTVTQLLTANTGLTVTGAATAISGGTIDLNVSGANTTNINTGGTGAVSIGNGTGTFALNSSAFDVSIAGALSGITTINTSGLVTSVGLTAGAGLIQGTNGLTITGTTSLATTAGNTLTAGNATGAVTVTGSSASSFVINGITVSATEFNLLDNRDTALVDTTDAVATAITGTGALNAGSITSGFGTINNAATITGTTLNATTGINTGAGAGTNRIDVSGNLVNIGTLGLSGAISGGTTFTGSGNINTTAGALQLNGADINTAGTLSNVAYENQANTFTLANTFSATSDAVALTGTPTASATTSLLRLGPTIAGGSVNGTYIGSNPAAFTGNFVDLQIAGAVRLRVTNTGATTIGDTLTVTTGGAIITAGDVAITAGNLTTAGTTRLTNAGALQNITTLGLSGAITGATVTNTINGLIINSGALSGITTLNASGLITGLGYTAGAGLIQGTAGLTITGNTSLSTAAGNTATIGNATGLLTLQGTSASTITGTNGGFTTTLGFTTPTANQTYNLPNQSAGTYTVCTTGNNCSSLTGYIQNGTVLQTTANLNIQSAATGSVTAALRQIAAQTADILQVRNSANTLNLSGIDASGNFYLGVGQSLKITGDITANRPAGPTEGQVWFDTTTKQLLAYANGKWQADRSAVTKIVAANNSSQAIKDAADYVAGATASQTEINSALTAAAGGKVYLAEGTYTLSAAISVPNNTTLTGAGGGTIITLPNAQNSTYNMIANTDTSTGTKVSVSNLLVDGNKAGQSSGAMNGITFSGMGAGSGASARDGGQISNVIVKNIYGGFGIYINTSNNNTITDGTVIAGGSLGIYLNVASNNVITGNVVQGNGTTGINISASSNTNVVTGNKVQGNNLGISVYSSSYNTVSSNTIDANTSWGVELSTGTYNNFTGNTVAGGSTGFSMNSSSSFNNFTGNTLSGNTGSGFQLLTSSNNNSINNNNISDNGNSTNNNGVSISASDYNSVIGNTINDTSCTTSCNAITIVNASSDKNYLEANRFTGSAANAAGINDAGTGTIYAGQQTNVTTVTNSDVSDFRFRGSANSTTAFAVQNASGAEILTVNTSTVGVTIGGTLVVTGLSTLNGGLTVETGDTFTFNGDAFTDLTGSGLSLVSNALTVDATTATGFFRNDGNDFGGNATLGTNTAGQTLTLETANTARFILSSTAATLTGQGVTTLASTGALTVSSASASAIDVATGTTGILTLDTGTTGAINLGVNANAKTINIGTGAAVVQTINMGGTGANVIAIGNTQTAGSVSLGSAMTTGTISLGGIAQTGTITLGAATTATTQVINISSANGTASTQTITVGGGTSTTSGGKVVNIANGIPGASTTNTVAIGSAGTTTGTVGVTIGSVGGAAHATTLQGGNGATALRLLTASGGTLSVGNNGVASTIQVGNTTGAFTQTINIGNNATASSTTNITVGSTIAGATTIQNSATINLNAGTIVGNATTQNLFDTVATTLNVGGAATALNIADGATTKTIDIGGVTASGTDTINIATNATAADILSIGSSNASSTALLTGGASSLSLINAGATLTGTTINLNSATIVGNQATQSLFNTVATTLNFGGAATTINLGASTGTTTINNALAVTGNSTFDGNLTFGNATGDTISFTGRVDTNILPSANDTYDLGSDALRWKDIYLGGDTLHIGTSTADEGALSYATASNILTLQSTGTISLASSTSLTSGSTLTVTAAATTLTGATSGDALTVSNSTSTGNILVLRDDTTAVFTVADGGNAAFGTTTSSTTGLMVRESGTGSRTGLAVHSSTSSASGTQNVIGLQVSATTSPGSGSATTDIYGIWVESTAWDTSTARYAYGVFVAASTALSPTHTATYGYYSQDQTFGAYLCENAALCAAPTGGFLANTQLVLQSNTNTTDNIRMALIAGTSGTTSIEFGDADDGDMGRIQYFNGGSYTNAMRFLVGNGTLGLHIDSSGNVGVGSSSPDSSLDVERTGADATLKVQYAGQSSIVVTSLASSETSITYNAGSGANGLTIEQGGGVDVIKFTGDGYTRILRLNTASATSICRNTTNNNELTSCSSNRIYKDNIVDLGLGLDTLRQLQARRFDWKADGRADLGFVAEEVEGINPLLAQYEADGSLSGVKYTQLTALLTEAVQELDVIVDNIDTRLSVVEAGQFSGSISVANSAYVGNTLTVSGDTSVQSIIVNGKIITAGTTPTATLGANTIVGQSGSVTVSGNDTAGSVSYTSGAVNLPSYNLSTGAQITATFATPFTSAPRIALTAKDATSASIRYYVETTTTGFTIHFIDAPTSTTTYTFDYIVIQ